MRMRYDGDIRLGQDDVDFGSFALGVLWKPLPTSGSGFAETRARGSAQARISKPWPVSHRLAGCARRGADAVSTPLSLSSQE